MGNLVNKKLGTTKNFKLLAGSRLDVVGDVEKVIPFKKSSVDDKIGWVECSPREWFISDEQMAVWIDLGLIEEV